MYKFYLFMCVCIHTHISVYVYIYICHITWLSTNQLWQNQRSSFSQTLVHVCLQRRQQTYFPTSEIGRHAIDRKIYVLRDYINETASLSATHTSLFSSVLGGALCLGFMPANTGTFNSWLAEGLRNQGYSHISVDCAFY